jgi:hypothetical protein
MKAVKNPAGHSGKNNERMFGKNLKIGRLPDFYKTAYIKNVHYIGHFLWLYSA